MKICDIINRNLISIGKTGCRVMLSREQVLEALKTLRDPRLDHPLAELGRIRDLMIKENKVYVTLVLAGEDAEIQSELQSEAEKALKALGAEYVHIRFRADQAAAGQNPSNLDTMQQRRQAELQAEGMPKLLGPGSRTKFIAVASGKGGVGKSTVTVNLAAALARLGKKTGIMDCDIYGFSIPDMMGIEEQPQLVGERIRPVERFGVSVISMGFFVQDNSPVIWRGPMLGKMIRNFFAEVEWDDIEYMLLDLPPGTGDVALDIHQMIPQSMELIVTTPHATASFVAARAGAMALNTNHEILGVVENMAYYECGSCGNKDYIFGRGGGAKLAAELRTELLAQIPLGMPDNHPSEPDYSPSVFKADTPIGKIYEDMARRIVEKIERR